MVVPEDPPDLHLQFRHRHVDPAVARRTGVPHAGQHIGNWISHAHQAYRPLPTGFAHAGNFPAQREITETNAAQFELPQGASTPPAALAAVVAPHLELGGSFDLLDPTLLRHVVS
jgi:hypothetical protein